MKFMPNKNQKAFTLVELLVVIAIIGILSSVVLLALNTARSRARDAKRVADIRELMTALELYDHDNGAFPIQDPAAIASNALTSSLVSGTPSYIGSIPASPIPADDPGAGECSEPNGPGIWNDYIYASTDGTSYSLNFCTGGSVGSFGPGHHTGSPTGIQ